MDIREHLSLSLDGLAEIESLTENLGNEPSLEEIESVVHKRDKIVTRMKYGEQQLCAQDPSWNNSVEGDPTLRSLLDESKYLLSLVADIDSRLASLIESRMAAVRKQLLSLFSSSRAAYSYTAHSTLRSAR